MNEVRNSVKCYTRKLIIRNLEIIINIYLVNRKRLTCNVYDNFYTNDSLYNN